MRWIGCIKVCITGFWACATGVAKRASTCNTFFLIFIVVLSMCALSIRCTGRTGRLFRPVVNLPAIKKIDNKDIPGRLNRGVGTFYITEQLYLIFGTKGFIPPTETYIFILPSIKITGE